MKACEIVGDHSISEATDSVSIRDISVTGNHRDGIIQFNCDLWAVDLKFGNCIGEARLEPWPLAQ